MDTRDGICYRKHEPKVGLPWRRVKGVTHSLNGTGSFRPDFSVPSLLMMFVEVGVDTETGKVELRRIVAATNVGQIIDPQRLKGQLFGALGAADVDTAICDARWILNLIHNQEN